MTDTERPETTERPEITALLGEVRDVADKMGIKPRGVLDLLENSLKKEEEELQRIESIKLAVFQRVWEMMPANGPRGDWVRADLFFKVIAGMGASKEQIMGLIIRHPEAITLTAGRLYFDSTEFAGWKIDDIEDYYWIKEYKIDELSDEELISFVQDYLS